MSSKSYPQGGNSKIKMQRSKLQKTNYYIGNYKKDAFKENHRNWIVGKFMEKGPRKTDKVEIKYWEFEVGNPNHETKISKTIECTFILEGELKGEIDGKNISLKEGQYVVIKSGTPNGFPKIVTKRAKGLTIKAPSDPKAKKVLKSNK